VVNAGQRIGAADLSDQFLPMDNGARPLPIGVQRGKCHGLTAACRHHGQHVLRPVIPLGADVVDQLRLVWSECDCHALLLSSPPRLVKVIIGIYNPARIG